jgi:hypothetical protein
MQALMSLLKTLEHHDDDGWLHSLPFKPEHRAVLAACLVQSEHPLPHEL